MSLGERGEEKQVSLGERGEEKQPRQVHRHTQLPLRLGRRFNDARSWGVTRRSFRPWRWPCGVPVRGLDRRSSTTFVPDLATEIDSANEALAEESADEIPTPALQGQFRAHLHLGHPANGEFCKALMNGRCRRGVVNWVKRHFRCPECEARPMPRARSAAAPPKCYRFNQVCSTRSRYS